MASNPPRQPIYAPWLPAMLVLLCGLLLTWLSLGFFQRSAEQKVYDYFMFRVREARALTEQRLLAQEQVLRGAQGLFAASGTVSRQAFHRYVSSLKLEENYPGIQGVGFAVVVPPSQLTQHTQQIRQESGRPDYVLHPQLARNFYTAIIYLEPFWGRNLRAFGYDMFSEPVRQKAMIYARDSNQVSMSGKVVLVQETEKNIQPGFLIYLPVYQHGAPQGTVIERQTNLIGWVYSPLRMNDFITGIFGERAQDLDIKIYDGAQIAPEHLLYSSTNNHSHLKRSTLRSVQQIQMGGNTWTLSIHALPSLLNSVDDHTPSWVGGIGLVASLLLALLVWQMARARSQAKAYAEQMNLDLIHSKQNLEDREATLKAILNASEVAIAWADEQGNIGYVNPKFILLFGYTLDEVPTVEQWYLHAYPDLAYREQQVAIWNAKVAASLPLRTALSPMEVMVHCRDGSIRHVIIMGSWAGTKLLALFNDFTWRKQAEEELQKLSTVVEQNPISIVITNLKAEIEYVNPHFTEVTGYAAHEVIGQNPRILKSGQTEPEVYQAMWHHLRQGQTWTGELLNRRKNGELYWEDSNITPVKNALGEITHYAAMKIDITQRKKNELLIKQMAHYDHLTGLPNRALLMDRLKQAINQARRDKTQLGLLFIDLDKFKPVNDNYGHYIGDLLLAEAATRLQACVRQSDTVARTGGDEFIVLLTEIENLAAAEYVAQKILGSLQQTFLITNLNIQIGCSIGIALYPSHAQDEQQLIKLADSAMYDAKQNGRNMICVYQAII